jgi:small subunit ribosomal protein S17
MPKRTLQGVVVSDKQAKTVVVRVDRRFTHPIYKKTIRRSKNYHAHDENNEFKPGRVLFEIDGVPLQLAKEALALAAAKLSITTRFVERIAE